MKVYSFLFSWWNSQTAPRQYMEIIDTDLESAWEKFRHTNEYYHCYGCCYKPVIKLLDWEKNW